MKLDELPPELLFKISTYLTLFDIGYSLIGVPNHLDKLLVENKNDRRTLAFHDGRCSYSLYRAFLDDHNGFRTRCLSIFIRSLILDGFCNITCAYGILSKWADSTPPFLPSVRILTLSNMQFFEKYCYKPLALIIACGTGTNIIGQLDKLTLEFETTELDDCVFNTSDWLARGRGVRHIVEEHLSSAMLLVYTYPCDLQNNRILVNHRFVARTIHHDRRATAQQMVWFCRNCDIDDINLHLSDNVKHSLAVLSRVYHLKWHWSMTTTGFAISRDPCFPSLCLRSLRLQMIGIDDTHSNLCEFTKKFTGQRSSCSMSERSMESSA
ncbi:unnamed protein product [Rotaria magnacalcarata]|uniref:F-box domain-containing protein n=1 Tax=Rotaria magnacalcarata TaxID=392030 RepID=A0A816RMI0_9BILA|nr:unnamed protein product [Rotaria magnacalcarata]